MTAEEIERILQTVAENQATHDEEFAMLLKSQNRYEERLATISEIMHDLADKQLKNEELFAETDKRFAQLADGQMRHEARMAQLEANYELFEQFVRDFREETLARQQETDNRFVETDKRLAEFVRITNRRFSVLERNGTAAKKKLVKKAGKKGSAK
ncbi:MAG: hypothetical protein MOB07_26275 [Acidobacteria bacterium]|nr:hypothetical protein [Acidobacteriota bacterium]